MSRILITKIFRNFGHRPNFRYQAEKRNIGQWNFGHKIKKSNISTVSQKEIAYDGYLIDVFII